MRPSEIFERNLKFARVCSSLVGVDVIVPDFKMNFCTYSLILLLVMFYSFSFNTVMASFGDDWTILLEVLCVAGSATTGVAKLISAVMYSKRYHEAYITVRDIYAHYEQLDARYRRALRRSCNRLVKILRLVGLVYLQMALFLIFVPVFMMLYTGQRYMMLHFYIPGLDVATDKGYWLTFAFQALCVLMAAFGLFAGDMFVLIFLIHALVFFDIFKLKVEDFNELIRQSDEYDESAEAMKTPVAEEVVTAGLLDILKWHQSYFGFTKHCNYIFYWIITVQIACGMTSILLTLFIMLTKDWPAAWAYLICGFNAIYEYCILGTKIEICNDQFCDEIYNIHWYYLNKSQQKTVRLMLLRAQTIEAMDIAGLMPLSVNTALSLTRSICSVFMMMFKMY